MNETKASSLPGIPLAVLFVLLLAASAALFFYGAANQIPAALAVGIVVFVIVAFLCKGFFQVQPNQGMVMLLFGRYAGTARETGLRWTNPFLTKRAVSLRVRNIEASKHQVNDADGKWITNFSIEKYDLTKPGTWQLVQGTADLPANAATADMAIEKGDNSTPVTVKLWLDDVRLELLEAP